MKKRVGIINSGGDCPALNTVIDAVVKGLDEEYEVIGFYKGFEGLLSNDYISLDRVYTSEHRWIGGTFLKSVNKGHFPGKIGHGQTSPADEAVIKEAYKNYQDLGLEGLIVIGGDGTLSMANNLQEYGFNIVGVPKSIDNDLLFTDFTFGFHTAVEITQEALDRLHTTATSHERVMILEVMGRDAGWIGLYSGIAGGANMILIPEIPFSYEKIKDFIMQRRDHKRMSSIIVVSEGAMPVNGEVSLKDNGGSSSEVLLGGISEQIAKYLNTLDDIEARATILGHVQRGGSPNSFDRILGTRYGSEAANLFKQGKYGKMVAYKNNDVIEVDIADAVKELKLVDPKSQIVKEARDMGISFGD
jgi:ATP-dependent phosphofructokinase / diphosphate-dependent phosphofructokinase